MSTGKTDGQRAPSILIVDDTPENLELLSAMLKERGCETRLVPGGKLALMAVRTEPPDLILLDINMPDLNGYEVCERLKADEGLNDIPVIFISAYTDVFDKVKAFSLGAVDYVTKPFHADEVWARVRTHLKLREYQKHLECLVDARTRELAEACETVREMSRIKDGFLRMISHELRTPANGLLGVGHLLLEPGLQPEEQDRYRTLFGACSDRLLQLIEDAALLSEAEKLIPGRGEEVTVSEVVKETQRELPDIHVRFHAADIPGSLRVLGSSSLLKRALHTLVRLACAFSVDDRNVTLALQVDESGLRFRMPLDNLTLPEEDACTFFELDSPVRGRSSAEPLGLAPVVAQRIVAAHGGELRLIKEQDASGSMEMCIPAL